MNRCRCFWVLRVAVLVTTLAPGALLPAQIRPTVAIWNPAAEEVLVGSQSGLQAFAWPTLTLQRQPECALDCILDLRVSDDGQRLAVAGGTAGETGILQLLDLRSGAVLLTCTPHTDRITQVCWLPSTEQILTASEDGTATVLDGQNGSVQQRITLHSRPLLAMTLCPGRQVATAGMDGIIRLWQAPDGMPIRTLENHTAPVTDLLVPQPVADGPVLLYSTSRDRTVRLWQPTRGRMVRFVRLNSTPQVLQLTARGDVLLVGCSDGSLLLLHPETLQVLRTEQTGTGGINALLQHPVSGDLLICTDQGLQRLTQQQLLP